ncbi:leukotoxin LktA family filamentous adhesin [Parasutterella excrementihominis]|uniref:leukotoxin LktA family filamentous adhesin n=2 Tax=Parasutterella excrementihominis TaxID=487175 RepID=UPI00242BD501|nr:leukotoxin LktA family filamentous adhesin [Parasutterella excrementihominis]
MNKIYKVIWNVCRGIHVVTDENHRAHGKEASSLIVPVELLVMEASLLTLPLTAVAEALDHAITVDPNWTGTTITSSQNNLHHDISTTHINGSVAANKFTKFQVGEKHLVDMHLPTNTNHLVNFVDNKISVNGTVNALKGSKVGGNLYFVSPQGMIVGKTGVINAGSLTAVITTDDAYKKYSELSDKKLPLGLGQKEEEALATLQKMQQGEVPLNPAGVITVNGSINAGNRITLAASQIHLESGAKLSNLETDFKDLVHIKEGQNVVTQSSVSDAMVTREADDGSGDILLLARSDSSATGSIAGSVTKQKVEAKVKVAKGAFVKSRGNVNVSSMAGNGVYDIEKTLRPSGYEHLSAEEKAKKDREIGHFVSDGKHKLLDVSSEIRIDGVITAAKDLDVNSVAENRLVKSSTTMADLSTGLTLEILGTATPFNEAVYYADLKTSSLISIGNEASLSADQNLSLDSVADTKLEAGTSTSLFNLFNTELTQKVPSVAAIVALADSSSTVNLAGALKAGKDLSITSADDLTVEASATAATKESKAVQTSILVAKLKGTSDINVQSSALLDIVKDAGKVEISSNQNSSVKTESSVVVQEGSYGGLAFNYTELDTHSNVLLNTGFTNEAVEASVTAKNVTDDLTIKADNAVGASGMSKLLYDTIGAVSRDFVAGLMGQAGQGVDSKFDSTKFKLGGAVGVVLGSQISSVIVNTPVIEGRSIGLQTAGNLTVSSDALLRDHHYLVTSKVSSAAPEGETSQTKFQGSLAVLVALSGDEKEAVRSILEIGNDSVLKANNGQLVLDSEAEIEWNRLTRMKEDFAKARDRLKAIFAHEFKDQWAKVEEAFDKADADFNSVSDANLSFNEKIKKVGTSFGTLGTALGTFFGEVKVIGLAGAETGNVVMSLLEFIKPTNYLNAYAAAAGDASSDNSAWSATGTAMVINQKTASLLTVGKNTGIAAHGMPSADAQESKNKGNLVVRSNTLNESLVLGGKAATVFGIPIPDMEKASALGATVVYNQLTSSSRLIVRENAQLTADNVALLTAQDSIYGLTIGAAADVNKGDLSLEGLAAVAVTNGTNLVWLDDESQVKGSSVEVSAKRDDDVQTIAGAVVVDISDNANKAAGAGIAVNAGKLGNELRVKDNDVIAEQDRSLYDAQGFLEASGADGKVNLLASEDLAMNAIGVAGGVGVSGHSPESNDPPGKISQFFSGLGDKATYVKEGLSFYLEEGGPLLAQKANGLGHSIRDKFNRNQSQNDPTSSSMSGNNNSNLAQNGSTASTTSSSTSGVAQGGTSQFQLGAAGSAAWNDTDTENEVNIEVGNFQIKAPEEVSVDAVTDKWVGAWAGVAGINYISELNAANYAAGIAGAVAGNTGNYKTAVNIDATKLNSQGLRFNTDLKKLNIRAVSDGTTVAEGLAAALSLGAAKFSGAFDAGVSANLIGNTVSTNVKGLSQLDGAAFNTAYNQASWVGDNQVTGGIGFSFGKGGNTGAKSFGGSLIFAVADIDNTVSSEFADSNLKLSGTSAVRALSDITQVTTAVSSAVTTGESSFALSGAAASSELTNNVSTTLNGLSISVAGEGGFEAAARSSGGQEADEFENLADRKWYVDNLDELNNESYFKDAGLRTSPDAEETGKDSSKEQTQNLGDLYDQAGKMKQITVAVSPAIGAGGSSGGAGVVVNQIHNQFAVNASGTVINTDNASSSVVLDAKDDAFSLGVAVGVAGGKGKFNAAGSVVVSNVDQGASVVVNDLTSTVNRLNVHADSKATTVNVGGNFGVNVGDGAIGAVGASVVVANTDNKASADVDGLNLSSVQFNSSKLDIAAANRASAWAAAADGAVSVSGLGIGGAVAVNRVKNDALVQLKNSRLTGLKEVDLHSSDTAAIWTLAGNVSVAAKGKAGLSGAVAYASSRSSQTQALVDSVVIAQPDGSNNLTDFTTDAQADDHISTLVLSVGVAGGNVGLSGAAGTNEINRSVNASVNNLSTVQYAKDQTTQGVKDQAAKALNALSVHASSSTNIDNLGIVAGVGAQGVGIGVGVAVNRVNTDTTAALSASDKQRLVSSDTLTVLAESNNDIDTIGIGGAGGSKAGVAVSTAINLVTNNTAARTNNLNAEYAGAALIQAQSDDTIGTYGGQIQGAQNAAVGATVTVSEKRGLTQAEILNSDIVRSAQETSSVLTTKAGVDENAINSNIVNDVSLAASLRDARQDKTFSGLMVDASSTETFKTFYITGGGAKDAAVTATGNVNYLGGKTETKVQSSNLNAGSGALMVGASDAANVDTVIATASGALGAAIGVVTNVITTDHSTGVVVTGTSTDKSSLTGTSVSVDADAKEGISSLLIAASGAQYAAVSASVNVNRQLSDVSVAVDQAEVLGSFAQNANYLGRITTSAITAAGSQYAAVPISVVINYADNAVSSSLVHSILRAEGQVASVGANRISEFSSLNVTASGAMYGAAAGLVNVNTIEGATSAEVNDSEVKAGQFSVNAENEDHLKVTDVTAAGAIGSLGASVVVSYLKGSSAANLRNSIVTADKLTVSSLQDHYVNGTVAFASGGIGTIGANVFSLVIGSGDNPFSSNRQDLGSAEDTVNKYLSDYASSGTGSLGFITENDELTQEEKDKIVGSAAAADAAVSFGSGNGTSVVVSGNHLTVGSADVSAKEDSKAGSIDVTLGSGSAGAGVLAASVITLRRHYNNKVNLSGNTITSKDNFNVLNSLEGKTNLEAIQTSLALASGTAAYADAEITGGASTIWEGNVSGGIKLEEPKPDGSKDEGNKAEENKPQTTNPVFDLKTENKSEIHLKSFGITVAAASGGGMVAEIRDKSRVESQVLNSSINSSFNASAVRQQKLFAESTAGYGGAINGVGALAKVYDGTDGQISARTIFKGNRVGGDVSLITNNRPDITVKSYGAGAGGLGIGVVQSIAETRGKVVSEVSGNVFSNANLTVAAGAGLGGSDGDESEALKMTADSQTYGGAIIASIPVNTSELTNSNQVESKIEMSGDSSLENFTSVTEGSAVYLSKTTAGTGGTIASGNNSAEVNHKVSVKNEVSSSSSVGLKNAAVTASNKEKATVLADSAGGGIILAEGTDLDANAAQVKHTDRSDTTLTVSGRWNIQDAASFVTSGEHNIGMKADNTKGALAGGSGASLINDMQGTNKVSIGDGSAINASGILVGASDNWDVHAAEGTYAVDSRVYGAFVGTGIKASNTENRTQQVDIGKNVVLTADDLTISAKNVGRTSLKVRAQTAGAVAGVTAENFETLNTQNRINLADGVRLIANSAEGTLTIAASSDEEVEAQSVGDVQGAAIAGAGAKVSVNQNRTNEVNVGSGSNILSKGKLAIRAGRDADGSNSQFDLVSYAHAYSHSAIGGTDSEVSDSLNLTNKLNLNGEIKSWRDTELYAQSGDVSTEETARYWFWTSASDAGEVSIASTAAGTKSKNLTTDNKIQVGGLVQAGVNTKADIQISGIAVPKDPDDSDSSVTDKDSKVTFDSQAPLTITKSGVDDGSVSEVKVESLTNMYWKRHEELQKAMADYGTTDPSLLAAYKAEDELLLKTMWQKGLLVRDGKEDFSLDEKEDFVPDGKENFFLIDKTSRPYVEISNVTVSGGNISAFTDSVTGAGSLVAKTAEGINIDNQGTVALKLSDIQILDKGGEFKLNDQVVTDKTGALGSFRGQLTTSANSEAPSITINSAYNGSVLVTSNGKEQSINPDTSIDISGKLINRAGNISVSSGGDVYADKTASISAGGSLGITAKGSITQSYSGGLFNVGGSVEKLWKTEVGNLNNQSSVSSNANHVYGPGKLGNADNGQAGDMVAGGSIFLAADAINLNGYVQSGYAKYGLTLSDTEVDKKIASIKANWQAHGSPSDVNSRTPQYALQEGGPVWDEASKSYKYQVAAWYDPVNDRVIVDDISPQGGQIYITGRVASTGGGQLSVANGSADININVGNRNVLLGNVDTGNIEGLIQITDTNSGFDGRPDNAIAKVTEIRKGNSVAYWLNADGTKTTGTKVEDSSYNPLADQLYGWTDGKGTTTVTTRYHSQDFTVWDAFNYGEPENWTSVNTKEVANADLENGSTIWVAGRPKDKNANFEAWTTQVSSSDRSTTTHWTTYNTWVHFSGTHHTQKVTTTSTSTLYSYTVKADHQVGTSFLSGTNTIAIESGKSVLLGGAVNALGGSVSLIAGDNILNQSGAAAITGASSLTLKAATGSIGSEGSAIKWAVAGSSDKPLNLSAEAGKSIYIDAKNLNSGASVSGSINAGETVSAEFRGGVDLNSLSGQKISLISQEGGINIQSLDHKEASDLSQRLDLKAAGDISLKSVADISVGQISTKGDVTIDSAGNIYDAIDRSDRDERSAQKRLESWIEAGILTTDGTSNEGARFAKDEQDIKNGITSDFNRYQAYLNHEHHEQEAEKERVRELTAEEQKDFAALKSRFAGCGSAEDAINKEANTQGSALNLVQASKGNYGWTQNELLFAVSEAILNPDPSYVPGSGVANIKAANITLKSGAGIGQELDGHTANISDLDASTEKGLNLYKLLARAEANDVTWNKEAGTLTINLKKAFEVHQSSDTKLNADAVNSIYLQSDSENTLNLGTLSSQKGDIRLTAANGITLSGDEAVKAKDLILRAGLGAIGAADKLLKTAISGTAVFSGNEGVFVEQTGTLNLQSVASGKDVVLKADNIYSVKNATEQAGRISGTNFAFETDGEIGQKDAALSLDSVNDFNVVLKGKPQNVYLQANRDSEMSVSVTEETVTSNVEISTEGSLKVKKLVSENGQIVLTAKNALDIKQVQAKNDVTAKANTVSVDETAKSTDGSLILKADSELSVADNSTLSAINGTLDLSAPETRLGKALTLEAKKLGLTTSNDISLTDSSLTAGTDGLSLVSFEGSVSINDGSLTSQNSINVSSAKDTTISRTAVSSEGNDAEAGVFLSSSEGAVKVSDGSINSNGSVKLSAVTDAQLTNVSVSAKGTGEGSGVEVNSSQGSVMIDAGQLDSQSSIRLTSAAGTQVMGADLIAAGTGESEGLFINSNGGAVEVTSNTVSSGSVIDIASQKDASLTVESLNAAGKLDVESKEGSINVSSEANGNTGGLQAAAENGSVTLKGLNVDSSTDIDVLAKDSISVTGGSLKNKDGSNLILVSKEGNLNLALNEKNLAADTITLKGKGELNLTGYTLVASKGDLKVATGGLNIKDASLSTSTPGSVLLSAEEGNVDSNNKTSIDSAGSLEVGAAGKVDLSAAKVVYSESGALRLTAGSTDSDALKVFAHKNNTFKGDEVVMDSAGGLIFADEAPITVEASSGKAVLKGQAIDLKSGSSVKARDEAVVRGYESLVLGDKISVEGCSVSVTGGKQAFSLGNYVSLTATNGGIEVLADADATLGGSLNVNASLKDPSAGDEAPIRIGAQGVLNVTEDEFEVIAENGSVDIFGGNGLNIKNDLTIVSASDSSLTSERGLIDIGNKATVKAGTQSGLSQENPLYGKVSVIAGKSFTIGDEAQILSDDLLVSAEKDIRFGDKATLVGATKGVTVRSSEGSIYMGENLTMSSNSDNSLFEAGKDIVIDRDATLNSEKNSVVFSAGQDIKFKEDFTVHGKGFELKAQGSLIVGDKATVQTKFGKYETGSIESLPQTSIDVKGDVRFGNDATFRTTMLSMNAGDDENHTEGNITFGERASIQTSVLGAVIDAQGDIAFGAGANIRTQEDQEDSYVRISSRGQTSFGENAFVTSGTSLDIIGNKGIFLDKGAVLQSKLEDGSKNHTSLVSEHGDIRLGENSVVQGQTAYIRTGDESGVGGGSIELGDNSQVSARDNVSMNVTGDVVLDGQFLSTSLHETEIRSSEGNVVLKDESELISYGDVYLDAAGSIDIGSDSFIFAGNDPDASNRVGKKDVSFTAGQDVTIGKGTVVLTQADLNIEAKRGSVVFEEETAVGVLSPSEDEEINRLTVSAGKDFTIKDTVMLFASEEAQLKAGGNFELGQGSVLAGDGLVKVEAGKDVSLKHGSGIEGFSSDGVENLEIHAERNVHQDASADGIASDRLEVSAGGSVELLAQKSAKDKELGNRVDELIVSAGSDINLVLNGQKQEIQINEEKGNIINGNLTIENYNGPLSVGYELTVNGHAEMKADSVLLKDLQASQDIYLEANGEIRANELASGADVTIVQRSADPSAAVVVKNVDAGDQIFVLNAGGPISLEKSVSGNSTMIFVSQDGYKPDRNVISSRSNRVGIFAAAPQMLSVFDRFGREISYLSKDSLQADQRHHHYALYRYGEDTHMPASRLFFNGYRAESVSPSNGLIKEALLFVTNRWQVNMGEEGAEEETED